MILVIGYGNPLCGDDGIGPYIVERLADEDWHGGVEWLIVHQLTPELAAPISHAETVIFVDAAVGDPPGEIECQAFDLMQMSTAAMFGAYTHHVSVLLLLESAHVLYGHCPMAYLYTVTGENFGIGDPISPVVESVIPSLLTQMKARLRECMNLVSPQE